MKEQETKAKMLEFLLFSSLEDRTAYIVYNELMKRHGEELVKLVSFEEIVYAQRWIHEVGNDGVKTEIQLFDGTCLRSNEIGIVFNRFVGPTKAHFPRFSEYDKEYAVMETYALLLSWLNSLPCPVISKASTRGISSQLRSQIEWLSIMEKTGLPVCDFSFTTNSRLFPSNDKIAWRKYPPQKGYNTPNYERVPAANIHNAPVFYFRPMGGETRIIHIIGDRTVGFLSEDYKTEINEFLQITEIEIAEIVFRQENKHKDRKENGDWKIFGINTFPQILDQPLVKILVDYIENKRLVNQQ